VALSAVQKRSLPDRVFAQLADEIVSGRYPPGMTIPSERELSSVLAVNRHVVREAIKRLEQIGLVKGAQGGRTKVLDYRRSAGLDLLALVSERAQPVEELLPLLAATLEVRAGMGVDLARLCAQRASREVCADLLDIAGQLAQGPPGDELLELDQLFWQRILDGVGNLAYQLAFNSLIRAVHARRDLSIQWLTRELAGSDHRRPIAEAIAAGDPEAAAAAAREALTPLPDEPAPRFGQDRATGL
jgi:GntR family transcriptional regulator, transcriptional repressor for pyruvate dehydrogenase complex